MRSYRLIVIVLSILFIMLISMLLLYNDTFNEISYYRQKENLIKMQHNNIKTDEKSNYRYSDVVDIVNEYDGEIKEIKNGSSPKTLDADLSINGNTKTVYEFLNRIKENKNVHKIMSISLKKNESDLEQYELIIDIEFAMC